MSTSPNSTMVAIMAVTSDQHAVCVRMAGDIDLAAEPDLADIAENLAKTRCSLAYIDLRSITFAGSSLIKFLFRLSGCLPGPKSMTLCRPGAMTLQLIRLTGLHEVAVVRRDLPADWTEPWAAIGKAVAGQAEARV